MGGLDDYVWEESQAVREIRALKSELARTQVWLEEARRDRDLYREGWLSRGQFINELSDAFNGPIELVPATAENILKAIGIGAAS